MYLKYEGAVNPWRVCLGWRVLFHVCPCCGVLYSYSLHEGKTLPHDVPGIEMRCGKRLTGESEAESGTWNALSWGNVSWQCSPGTNSGGSVCVCACIRNSWYSQSQTVESQEWCFSLAWGMSLTDHWSERNTRFPGSRYTHTQSHTSHTCTCCRSRVCTCM